MSDSSLPKAPRQLPDVAAGVQHRLAGVLLVVAEAQELQALLRVAAEDRVVADAAAERRAARLRRIRTRPR